MGTVARSIREKKAKKRVKEEIKMQRSWVSLAVEKTTVPCAPLPCGSVDKEAESVYYKKCNRFVRCVGLPALQTREETTLLLLLLW